MHQLVVRLGTLEETVTITRTEAGTWILGNVPILGGKTIHTAANGNEYVLMITTDESGAIGWMATYRAPMIPVPLGMSGETVTLEKAEDGSYRLNEMAVTSGETTATAGNGNSYTLTLDEHGMWTTEYREVIADVMLGMSGETVAVRTAEDGSYWLGEMVIESGETVATASNGSRYRLMLGADGMWTAEFQPMTGTLTVGNLGMTLEALRAEDGTWTVVSPDSGAVETLAENARFEVGDNIYTLSSEGDGTWVATYRELVVDVILGTLNETVVLRRMEDGSYWLDEMRVEDGVTTVSAANGNEYTLRTGEDGMWMAQYEPQETTVELGMSGTAVAVVRAEDGTFTLNGKSSRSGIWVMPGGGNEYLVTMADGVWTVDYVPEILEIEGTGGLLAISREDGQGYNVAGTTLPSNGRGEIETYMAEVFRVRMQDGMLVGTRLDKVELNTATDFKTEGLSAMPTIREDDRGTTDVNEANTALVVAGENYSFADLLGEGVSRTKGKNFVADARTKLMEIREKIEALLDLFDTDRDRDEHVEWQWGTGSSKARTNVKSVLQSVFGASMFTSLSAPDDDTALERIDELIQAFSNADALAEALGDHGALKDVADAADAARIFTATATESTVTYGKYGNTRFGTISRKQRDDAVSDAVYEFSAQKGERGAFAFGVTEETARVRYVQIGGAAQYEGSTLALSGAGAQYVGGIEIAVNFKSETVDGLITDLATYDGEPWTYMLGVVDNIVLPTVDMDMQGIWKQGSADVRGWATVNFSPSAGAPGSQRVRSTFQGRLLGGRSASDAGSEVVGVWSLGADTDSTMYLAGGFGAGLVSVAPVRRPSIGDGTRVAAVLVDSNGATSVSDDNLTIRPRFMEWHWEPGGYLNFRQGPAAGKSESDMSRTLNEEISIAALLAAQGKELHHDSPQTHVMIARKEIQTLRDRIAGLQIIGDSQDRIDQDWQAAQIDLLGHVFFDYGSRDNDVHIYAEPGRSAVRLGNGWEDQLPSKVNGGASTPAPDDVVDRLDAVLKALSSLNGFKAAFDPAAAGIFVVEQDGAGVSFLNAHIGDYDTNAEAGEILRDARNTTPATVFGQRDWQVRATAGTTDYTRYGAWRIQWARNALRIGDWQEHDVESFAFSPLSVATAAHRLALPDGGEATYEGKTAGYVGTAAFAGDVRVKVRWFEGDRSGYDSERIGTMAHEIGGHVTTVISDLRNISTGGFVYHDGNALRQMSFATTLFSTDASRGTAGREDDHDLDFTSTGVPDWSTTTADYFKELRVVDVGYWDTSVDRPDDRPELSEYEFTFVGRTPVSPLGVIGRYEFAASATGNRFGTSASEMNRSLVGAFGADLP